ncbi:MAG: sigma-70 family RNA polymerase sigma factor [Microcystaceae cyanobacterium]
MRPRQELIELFSTFMQFEADDFKNWAIDIRLRRSMGQCLEQFTQHPPARISAAPTSEVFWSLYWHQCWQTSSNLLAEQHLSAYLQEPCYWAAWQTARRFQTIQFNLPDYFQMAIAQVNTVLKRFNPHRSASLRAYANLTFPSLLRDILRQRQEADLCTNWGLLRKVSKKRFLEALQHAGLPADKIAQYRLGWMCFQSQYVEAQPDSPQLPEINYQFWEAVAHLYNTQRTSQLLSLDWECSPETIERWLSQCALWVRAYLYPPVESLNVPKSGLESGEVQDDVPDSRTESLLMEMSDREAQQERQIQQSQIHSVLVAALEQLDPQSQALLKLYYRDGQTQQQMMEQLQMSQATVSRRLTKAREGLLTVLVKWSQQTLNSTPMSNRIKDMSAALEEWLSVYYDASKFSASTTTEGKETR